MLENIALDPFDGEIMYGHDENGENTYIRVFAFFEYNGQAYIVYQFTTETDFSYIASVLTLENDEHYSFEVDPTDIDDDTYAILAPLWNEYIESLEVTKDGSRIIIREIGGDQND